MIRAAFTVAILAVVVYKAVETALRYGVHLHYKKHYPGDCRQVPGIDFGSEDLQVTKDGSAFITSGLTFSSAPEVLQNYLNANNPQGNIYLYDFKQPEAGARKLTLTSTKEFNQETFHPHGISILEDGVNGEHLLYVINHPEGNDGDIVEKFRYLPKTNQLVHLKSFKSELFHFTNDLVVVQEDVFYITNCLYFENQYLSMFERTLLPIGLGSVVFFNGTGFRVVDSWLHGPNGITLSKDKRYLYINYPFTGEIKVYERKDDDSLIQIQSVDIHTAADNLELSQSGDSLYTGAHPILYEAMQHFQDPSVSAPSSVLKIPLKDGRIVSDDITELFYDHGQLISASSIASVYNRTLLIGSVIHKLVVCDVNVKI